jgi:hypothetical protein
MVQNHAAPTIQAPGGPYQRPRPRHVDETDLAHIQQNVVTFRCGRYRRLQSDLQLAHGQKIDLADES